MKMAAFIIAVSLIVSVHTIASSFFDDCLLGLLQFLKCLIRRLLMCDDIPLNPLAGAC